MTFEERIRAPRDRVWAAFTDFDHAAESISAIRELVRVTDGPWGKGSRFRETRVMFGKEATEEMEITRWEIPAGYDVEAESCGAHFHTRFDFVEDGDGTIVRVSFRTRPLTLVAKLMAPAAGLMARACRKAMLQDIADLRSRLEAGPAEAGVPG